MSAGESQYRARVEDIRILKLEIKKLRRERGLLKKSVSAVDELKCVPSWLLEQATLVTKCFPPLMSIGVSCTTVNESC